jgi:hypothetical protein
LRLKIGYRPPDIGVDQIQHRLNGAGKSTNAQISPDHHQGYADALEKVRQIAVDCAELHVADLQLFVQRVQFFVRRFQLFLRGFQLFVGRLRLFVRRPELFQGACILLNDRLQVRFDCHKLAPQPGASSVVLSRGLLHRLRADVRLGLFKQHQEVALLRGRAPERDNLDGDGHQSAIVFNPEALFFGCGVP